MLTLGETLHSIRRRGLTPLVALLLLLAPPSLARANTITFDDLGLEHGEIVTGVPGVTIEADNFHRTFGYAVAFDSNETGTADPDLEFGSIKPGRWAGGNIKYERLGLMLILQENNKGCESGVGICTKPDDEGQRPAGTISFLFDDPITSFGFDLIDVDSLSAENGSITFVDIFDNSKTIDFDLLLECFDVGNNFANRIAPFTLEELGLEGGIDEVVFLLGGSGALDNITYGTTPIPEPATAVFVGVGLLGLGLARRRRP